MRVQIILVLFLIVILNGKQFYVDEHEHDDKDDFNLQAET
jgi:hypothetical protein